MAGGGAAVLTGIRFANATRTWQADEDTAVTDWVKANDFIVAVGIEGEVGTKQADSISLEWRNVTQAGSFTALAATGELNWTGATDLVNDNALATGEAGCTPTNGTTWQDGTEHEASNDALFDSNNQTDRYTEYHYAIDSSGATSGEEYEFRVWDTTDVVSAGTGAATITMVAGAGPTLTIGDDPVLFDAIGPITESVAGVVGDIVDLSVFDGVTVEEDVTVALDALAVSVNDEIGTDESVSGSVSDIVDLSVFDSVGTDESVSGKVGDIVDLSVFDSVGTDEDVTVNVPEVTTDLDIDVYDEVSLFEKYDATVGDVPADALKIDGFFVRVDGEFVVIGAVDLSIDVYDEITAAENVSALGDTVILNVFDSVGTDESVEASVDLNANIYDEIALTESIDAATGLLGIDVYDGVALEESVNANVSLNTSVYDEVSLTESKSGKIGDIVDLSVFDDVSLEEDSSASVVSASDVIINVYDEVSLFEKYDATVGDVPANALKIDGFFVRVDGEFVVIGDVDLSINVFDGISLAEDITIDVLSPNAIEISVYDEISLEESIASQAGNLPIDVYDAVSLEEYEAVSIGSAPDVQVDVYDEIGVAESVEALTGTVLLEVFDAVNVIEDVSSQGGDLSPSIFDGVSLDEDITLSIPSPDALEVSIYDEVGTAESVGSLTGDCVVDVFDAVSVAEMANVEFGTSTLIIDVYDGIAVAEDVDGIVSEIFLSVYDEVSIAEYTNEDIYTGVESLGVYAFDAVGITESVKANRTLEVSVYDTATIVEYVNRNFHNIEAIDSIVITEDVTVELAYAIEVNDTATITESISSKGDTLGISVNDSVNVVDIHTSDLADLIINMYEEVTAAESVQCSLYVPLDLSTDYVARLKLDEATGNTAVDEIGSYDGTFVNGPGDDSQWVTGYVNNGLEFDGSDDRLELPDIQGILNSDFTLSMWVEPDATAEDYLFCTRMYDLVSGEWSAFYASLSTEVNVVYRSDGDSLTLNCSGGSADWNGGSVTAAFQNIVITAEEGGYLKIYVNGKRITDFVSGDGSLAGLTMADFYLPAAGSPKFVIGEYASHNGSSWSYSSSSSFNGIMDDFRLYDRALSADEIANNYLENDELGQNRLAMSVIDTILVNDSLLIGSLPQGEFQVDVTSSKPELTSTSKRPEVAFA